MSPLITIGNGCIGLSVGFSLLGMILFFASRRTESSSLAPLASLAAWGRGSVYANFILITTANLAKVYGLLSNDFGISYVAHVGSLETPRWISAISLWSSLEGSILFWGWILTTYAAVCIYIYRDRDEKFFSWVGLTLLFVELFFFLLLALPANPFLPVIPAAMNGPGPNPLLQNHWLMSIHPPFLYIGYIGFTVPFAFAIASLLETGEEWISWARPWILFAWSFLSMAIVLGGWWSYAVLGWGGYWAWDPVENASFMPWLTGTALVHSIIVYEKRKMLHSWNVMLAILTFLLTLLGTFLTRSGVLDSVHSFTESHVGPYFLVFIGITLVLSMTLLLWKSPQSQEQGKVQSLFSLEVLFLFNNLLFLSFCFIVFLGTLYPLIVEAIKGQRISVGEPYFNQMTVPIVGMILLLMGIGLATPWKKGSFRSFLNLSLKPAVVALLITGCSFFRGARNLWLMVVIFLASFAFLIMLFEVARIFRQQGVTNLFATNRRRYGGFVSHLGALIIIVAIAISSLYKKDHEITLQKGESGQIGRYTLTLQGITAEQAAQRFEIKAIVQVSEKGKILGELTPQMNFYPMSQQPIGSPAVRSTPVEDLYLTLISFEQDGSKVSIRAMISPAVSWIWIGGVLVMIGGLIAL
ncbi:MAG: cytochrome c-type biogenesis CcmF C-terminal domain-containing protein [Deltaproteobacteria bacterium]|nr:cytochrome c-type biogenesis CcmF C-terminal domain-containing protein [Deltaproteobacteria bacterium]